MKKKITQNIGEEKTVFPRVRKGETVVLDMSFKKTEKSERKKSPSSPFLQHHIDVFEKCLEILFVLDLHLEYTDHNIVGDRILVFYLF